MTKWLGEGRGVRWERIEELERRGVLGPKGGETRNGKHGGMQCTAREQKRINYVAYRGQGWVNHHSV